jgi:regulator of sigma E protease
MAAEDAVEPGDPANYANQPAWKRLLVIGAGPAANYLLSFLVGIALLLMVHKAPNMDWTRVGSVSPGYPAAAAGVREGDEITVIDGAAVRDWVGLRDAIGAAVKRHPDQPVPIVIHRGATTLTLQIQPRVEGGGAVLGVTPAEQEIAPVPVSRAVVAAAENLWLQTALEARMIGEIVMKHSASSLSGPIGIIGTLATQAKKGILDLVETIWALSIAVGFFNMLPVPGLDGGRFLFLLYEVLARRRMDQVLEGWIHLVGLALMLMLILYVSFGDVMRIPMVAHFFNKG